MTLVILHRASLGELPYRQWLEAGDRDIVLLTDQSLTGFADTAAAELAVLELAARTRISGLVALHPGDQIRAGSLRDHLRVPGQTRDQAVAAADSIRAGELLAEAGVPVLPRAAAGRISDLYRAAHAWGYPLVVRRRRSTDRTAVAELTDEAALRAFARGGLTEGARATAALTVEPQVLGERQRGPGNAAAAAALRVLDPAPGHPLEIEAVCDAQGQWRVDTVRYTGHLAPSPAVARAVVRAQATVQQSMVEPMEAVR